MSTVNDWNMRTWMPAGTDQTTSDRARRAAITNAPAVGSLYAIPNDIRYHFADRERERINGAADAAVRADRVAHADRGLHLRRHRAHGRSRRPDAVDERQSFQPDRVRHRAGGGHAPAAAKRTRAPPRTSASSSSTASRHNKLKSPGFNANWQVTERFNLDLDIHDSKATSLPNDPVTGGGETLATFAVRVPSVCDPARTTTTARTGSCRRSSSTMACRSRRARSSPETTTSVPASGGDPNFDFTTGAAGQPVPAHQLPGAGHRHHAGAPRWRARIR